MAKAYFIGGAPRTGKTGLTLRFIKEKPTLAASTDAIRYMLRQTVNREDHPDLFNAGKFTSNDPERREYLISHADEVIESQNKESAVVWEAVNSYVMSNLEDGYDVLIEGVAVLPELIAKLEYDYSVVFVGNQSAEHTETIIRFARSNQNDWMHELEDETIRAFAVFNRSFSKHIEDEARKFRMPYIEIRDEFFGEDMDKALELLLQEDAGNPIVP